MEHEKLSVAIFQRILTNPKVLGEFVYEGLKDGHVKLIGNMISPPDHELNERDDRLFLYEVNINYTLSRKIRSNTTVMFRVMGSISRI